MGLRKRPALCAAVPPSGAKRQRRSLPLNAPSGEDGLAAARNNVGRSGSMESYKILKKIGEGGFGAVSKAEHVRTGNVFAVKSLLFGGDEEELLHEAELLALCRGNPTVVNFCELARCPKTKKLYLVLEFVEQSLFGLLKQRRSLSENDTRHVMLKLLEGVEAMHAQGVVHRDLKPANVLVGERDRRIKICDFGIGKNMTTAPPHTQYMGTVMYMAPEQLAGEEDYGAAVDLWSLGCIMRELLTGERLFDERSEEAQLRTIVDRLGVPGVGSLHAVAPTQLRKMVPEGLLSQDGFDVLRGLLEYESEKRLTATAALQMPWFATEDAHIAAK